MTTGSVAPGLTTSVVICAYAVERWDDLQRAVASALAQVPQPTELFLVIDHNQALLERCRAAFGDRVMANAGPRGLSGARNTGLAAAAGDLVLFLDDDAAAEAGWLAALASEFADPEVLGAGGRVLAAWDVSRPRWFPAEFDWVVGCSYIGLPTERAVIRNPIGAGMAFRRSTMEALGGFRHVLGRSGAMLAGDEETDLAIRCAIRWPSSRILYLPNAVVTHRVRKERGRFSYFLRRCLGEGYSKAVLSRLVGVVAGTATERTYVGRTLPAGIVGNMRIAIAERRLDGAMRAAAILAGLAVTGAGYVAGTVVATLRPPLAR